MAFCVNCGAAVAGSFCSQCGTAARPQAAEAAAPPPMPPPAAPVAGAPAPVAAPRKTSPVVWIVVILLGLFVFGAIAVIGTGFFIARKAVQAGLDTDLMQRNPGLAVAKLITTVNPDTEIVRTDERAGTITVRDRRTGKVTTLTFDDIKAGKFNMKVEDENGQTATVEVGGANVKLPSWVPSYPGATPTGKFAVRGVDNDGSGEGGSFAFTTSDPPDKVIAFYQEKAKELNMLVNLTANSNEGGVLILTDDSNRRNMTVAVGRSSSETTVNVTYGGKR